MSRVHFNVETHSGHHLRKNLPSVWLLTWATVMEAGKERVHILARDPFPDRGDKDQASFLHIPARKLFPHDLVERNDLRGSRTVFDLAAFTEQTLLYTGGLRTCFSSELAAATGGLLTRLHHEPTALFSGPQENNQVICYAANVGWRLPKLPDILTREEGGAFPEGMDENALAVADHRRKHVAWLSFDHVMGNLKQIGTRIDSAIYAPSASPFRVAGVSLSRGKAPQDIKIQGTVLWLFERFNTILRAQFMGVPVTPPPGGRNAWVTEKTISRALYDLDGGAHREDPRVKTRLPSCTPERCR